MKAIQLTETLYRYLEDHAMPLGEVFAELVAETKTIPHATMQISPSQGAFMHLLARLTQAKRALEVGCYTGYSALSVASALPADGILHTLDINRETSAVAQRYFAKAGLSERIQLHLGPASTSLANLLQRLGPNFFDMMFIDADKPGMIEYYEQGLTLVRPGGLILADNVLWSGLVVDPEDHSEDTDAIRRFNAHVRSDPRVEGVMLPVADGLYLLRKKP